MESVNVVTAASQEAERVVFAWLRDFNYEQNGVFMRSRDEGAERPVSLVAKDDGGRLVGGLLGSTLHSWLRIDLMAVTPAQRGKGVGSKLVAYAEALGTASGCKFSYVDTMSYQAPGFYRNIGYQEVGRLPNWDSHGHDKSFFMKTL